MSGVRVKRTKLTAYALGGLLAAISGMYMAVVDVLRLARRRRWLHPHLDRRGGDRRHPAHRRPRLAASPW